MIPSEGSLYSNLKYDGVHWIDFFTNNLTAFDEAVPEEQTVRLMNEDMTVEKARLLLEHGLDCVLVTQNFHSFIMDAVLLVNWMLSISGITILK